MNTQNIKLKNVLTAYSNVLKDGTRHQFNGEPWVPNMVKSHVQGIACYGNYICLPTTTRDIRMASSVC